jgi:hypothetical protein
VNGIVDEDLRALIEVSVGSAPNGAKSTVVVWIANDGANPLLGTMLLDGRDLAISYKRKSLTLE